MIVVVADTSPLNYLVQIGCQEQLAALYERVLVPPAVMNELHHPRTPAAVRAWVEHLPAWVEIRAVQSAPLATLAGLDPGEQEAIQLAQEQHADLLLMDERRAVAFARRQGLEVTGTLGVLVQAARLGLVEIDAAVNRLQTTGFRATPELFAHARASAAKVDR
jgi:predicted nucleic acid-binding protein